MNMHMQHEKADLLYGVPAIAGHMMMGERQVYHLVAKRVVPTFKIGGKICARRSTIDRWLADMEAAALEGRSNG